VNQQGIEVLLSSSKAVVELEFTLAAADGSAVVDHYCRGSCAAQFSIFFLSKPRVSAIFSPKLK
jgi:hypothetical protein